MDEKTKIMQLRIPAELAGQIEDAARTIRKATGAEANRSEVARAAIVAGLPQVIRDRTAMDEDRKAGD